MDVEKKALTNSYGKSAGQVFLTEVELAKRWRVSTKKLQADRWKEQGVPFVKIGRSVRYRLAEVIAYEERHVCHPRPSIASRCASSNHQGIVNANDPHSGTKQLRDLPASRRITAANRQDSPARG